MSIIGAECRECGLISPLYRVRLPTQSLERVESKASSSTRPEKYSPDMASQVSTIPESMVIGIWCPEINILKLNVFEPTSAKSQFHIFTGMALSIWLDNSL